MTEDNKTKGPKDEKVPEDVKDDKVDIPDDKGDTEAVEAQEETEKGKRPQMTKGSKRPPRKDRYEEEEWVPKTKLGQLVKSGKITTMHQALNSDLPLREPQIVDTLIGEDLVDEVLKVNMVQRMTDSGRRTRFSITVVVGNSNGYVGLGSARGKEVGPTIKKAIDNAKLNMIELTRGCGSWECGCMTPHSLPFKVLGKAGSTQVTLSPAPRGVGLAVGDVAKKILKLAGINDAWGYSRGQTKTTVNNAKSVISALKGTTLMRVQKGKMIELKHKSGPVMDFKEAVSDAGGDLE
jgi:small subunit ribosomal protein S5